MAPSHQSGFLTVKIRREVMPELERLVKNSRDKFGIPRFRSKSDAVTQAVREFLLKNGTPTLTKRAEVVAH